MRTKITKTIKAHGFLILTLLLTFLVYSKLLVFGAISWDDPEMVFKNTDVKQFQVSAFFCKHYVGNYIPFTMLLHGLNWILFQDWTGGHHLISILIHLCNGYLVYKLSEALFQKQIAALTVMLVFLLHPLQVESVAWISETKTLLSASFFLFSILLYLRYLDKSKWTIYALSFLAYGVSALAKPSVLLLPFILFLIDILLKKNALLPAILRTLPFLILSCSLAYVTIQTQSADLFINHAHEFNYILRGGFAGYAIFSYLMLFLAPINLSVIYPYPILNGMNIGFGYISLLLIVAALYYCLYKKKNNLAFGLLFFLLNIALMLQFIPFGETLYADRYMYLSIIGLAWFIGFLLNKFKMYQKGIFLFLLCISAFLSYGRLGVWHDSLYLYEDILKKYPDSFVALNSAGAVCMMQNDHEKSLRYFKHAITVSPGNYKGYYNLGLLYLKNNQADQAIESFNRAIRLYDYYKAYNARASAYYMLNDLPKAMNDANKAIQLDAKNHRAHFVLGNCYNDLNQLDEALGEYNLALQLEGEESDYYFKRAIVYGKKQDFHNSLSDLTVCLNLNSLNIEAHYWKGVALINLNRNPCEDLKIAAQNNFEPALNAYRKYCR